jgi:hypothetical protein
LPSEGPKNRRLAHERLRPEVETKEIKAAVAELVRLDLLTEDKTHGLLEERGDARDGGFGALALGDQFSRADERARRQGGGGAKGARARVHDLDRGHTSEKSFQKAKEEIRKFRDHLHSILEQEGQEGPEGQGGSRQQARISSAT